MSRAEIKKMFPLIEEDQVMGGMFDPDAGLVIPRSQTVAGKLVDAGEKSGKLQVFGNTPAKSLIVENGRIKGVVTHRGTIMADHVIVCAGIWGRLIAEMVGEDLPVMPVDHPLTFFGPYNEFEGTGKEIGFPLLRDQGNSAYMRDTGDPKTTEGGQIEWGYYEQTNPRLCHPRDILEKHEARLSPSQRDLDMEQILEPLEKAMELTPILGELGYNEGHSFNGLLQVSAAGGPSCGESQKVRGLWYCVAIWVKDGPGYGKLIADWMTDGRTEIDHNSIDYARFYPHQLEESSSRAAASKPPRRSTFPAVHTREPYATGRNVKRSPFYEREKELGGYFMELGGWERAHGYAANEHLLEKYGNRVPVRENEWDNRHFWRVSNAEHLAMSEDCGIVNLSHFHMVDIEGPGPCRAAGMALRRQDRRRRQYRQGHLHPLPRRRGHGARRLHRHPHGRPLPPDQRRRCRPARLPLHAARRRGPGPRRHHHRRDREVHHHRHLGPECPRHAEEGRRGSGWTRPGKLRLRRDQADRDRRQDGHRLPHLLCRRAGLGTAHEYEDGLAVWDALRATGVMAFGVETYANSRRMEKSLRLQNADLLTQYNLIEADLARPKVKEADFRGKAKHLEYKARDHQPAMLCTLVMTDNTDSKASSAIRSASMPVMDPDTGKC